MGRSRPDEMNRIAFPRGWWLNPLFGLVAFFFLCGCQSLPGEYVNEAPPDAVHTSRAPALYYFSLAQMKIKENNIKEAVWLMERAIESDPRSSYLKLELVGLHLANADSNKALVLVRKVLEERPGDAQALTLAGRIYQQQQNMAEAQKAFEQVLAQDDAEPNIFLFLGRLYWDANDMANAHRVFRKMATRFPESYVAHYFYGKVLAVQDEAGQAEQAFLKSLELEPSLEEPRLELLKIYQNRNQTAKITQTYEEIIANNPENFDAALGLAQHYRKSGNLAAGERILTELGQRVQDGDGIIKGILERYLEPKDFDGALWALDAMLRSAPDNSDLNYLAGAAYDGLAQPQAALEHLEKVQPTSVFYRHAILQRAAIFHDGGDTDGAIALLETAARNAPRQADFYLYLGIFLQERERFGEAIEALQRGLRVDDRNSRLYFQIGVVSDKMGRKDESIAAMQTAVRLKPDHAEALNYLGYTYADLGINLEEAEAMIQKALQLKPDDGYITDSLGWVHYKQGRYQEALKYLIRATELIPDDPIILEHLGDVYLQLGQPEKALLYYQRSLVNKNSDKEALKEKMKNLQVR